MSGLGYRTFAASEVLTAANVQGYLMKQSAMVFGGTAARGSALGTAVSEGMISYLTDSNSITVYDGSAWQTVYPSNTLPITVTSGATALVGKIFVHNPTGGTPTGAASGDLWIW